MVIDWNYRLFTKPIFIGKIRYLENKIVRILISATFFDTSTPAAVNRKCVVVSKKGRQYSIVTLLLESGFDS